MNRYSGTNKERIIKEDFCVIDLLKAMNLSISEIPVEPYCYGILFIDLIVFFCYSRLIPTI